MNFGFVSAILEELSLEEVVAFASEQGFDCIEVMCWPKGKAVRRYAGITHIDVDQLDDAKVEEIKQLLATYNVKISSLGYYPNPLDPDLEKRETYGNHISKLIDASKKLGINMVTTFIGRDKDKTTSQNLDLFEQIWTPIVKHAEEQQVKIAIENCPMYFSEDEWPSGLNLATTPKIWREMFKRIPSDYLGINYDPSHFVWQQMDYIKPLYEFKEKIFHVHYKDIKVYKEKLADVGIMATPLEYMAPKLPGLGDVNWGQYVAALNDIRYTGDTCIEVEDKAYESNVERKKQAVILSKTYLRQFVI